MKFTHAGACAGIALLLALTGCSASPIASFGSAANGRAKPLAADPKAPNTASETVPLEERKPNLTLDGELDSANALRLMYGNYDAEAKRAQWKPTRGELDKFNFYSDIKSVYSKAYFLKSFQEGDTQRYIVITRTAPSKNDCEGCVPVLSGALFTKQGTGWKLDTQSKALSRLPGELFGGKLVKIGPDRYGVNFHWKNTNLGVTEEGELLIAETKSGLQEVFSMVTSGNNRKFCEDNGLYNDDPACWSYTSKIEYLPNASTGYHDIRVTSTGNKQIAEDEVAPVRETKRFVFAENGYRPARQ